MELAGECRHAQQIQPKRIVVANRALAHEKSGHIVRVDRPLDTAAIETKCVAIASLLELPSLIAAVASIWIAESLDAAVKLALEAGGVTPLVGRRVVGIDERSVTLDGDSGESERIRARTVIWAAGVVGSPLARALAEQSGAALDRGARVAVGPDVTLPGHPEVTVVGYMASVHDASGRPLALPGLAPVAMQEGRYAANAICTRLG